MTLDYSTTIDSYRHAGRNEFRSLSWSNTSAFFARKPRWLRWLRLFSWFGKAAFFYSWLAAGEVYAAGDSSSVVMTVHKGDRRGRLPGVWLGVGFFIGFILLVVGVVLLLPFIVANAVLNGILLLMLLAVVGLLVGALPYHPDPLEKPTITQYAATGSVVVLHDLVRGRDDSPGTGTALLAAVIRDPAFAAFTVVATATTAAVADRYCEAGMTRISPESRVVIREAARRDDGDQP